MGCDGVDCEVCPYLNKCGRDDFESEEVRQCGESCGHYDSLNQCCWQLTEKGLFFYVSEGDYCHLGYKENDLS